MELRTKTRGILAAAVLTVAAGLCYAAPGKPAPRPNANEQGQNQGPVAPGVHPKVEVVFVVDTTGSMGGLIQGAKEKIWSIAKHIASAKPTPEVTIGLVAYRDIGDAYVTKKFALSGDMDGVFEHLMAFRAEGGGDTPEHVAKGLYDAVYGMQWSDGAMKMIFLVGDAPPHVDYHDGFDYQKIIKEASRREIRVHTVRCGNDPETARYWQEIAHAGHGTFATIAENGGVAAVATPMDGELAELGRKLNGTEILYGDTASRGRAEHKAAMAAAAPPPAAADRGAFYATSGAKLDEDDVLDKAAAEGGKGLASMDTAKLPEPMQAMKPEERKEYVVKKKAEREAIVKEMQAVSARRDAYLKNEAAKDKKTAGFDDVVTRAISDQGKDYGLAY
jgi:hypothetical protein